MYKMTRNVLIADDHLLVRGGLQMIFSNYFSEYTLHFASNFKEIMEKLDSVASFELLILDVNFENENSLSFISNIFDKKGIIPVLIYSGVAPDFLAPRFKEIGVKGFLRKTAEEKDIVKAIRTILSGQEFFTLNENLSTQLFQKLTTREFEVMSLTLQGYGNIEISSKLDIQSNTISTFKKRILEKLNVRDFVELRKLYNTYFTSEEDLVL